MFSFSRKIEEIRKKPENIRMRYVWFWLTVCMIFIFALWVFSVKENFSQIDFDEAKPPNLRSGAPEIQEVLPEIGGAEEGVKKSISELESEILK